MPSGKNKAIMQEKVDEIKALFENAVQDCMNSKGTIDEMESSLFQNLMEVGKKNIELFNLQKKRARKSKDDNKSSRDNAP